MKQSFLFRQIELVDVVKMNIEKKQKIEDIWTGLVYAPKQIEKNVLDLTINSIYSIKGIGALDFGGSEHIQATIEPIIPVKEYDPKYGWWNLQKGNFFVTYNESLKNNTHYALISPHARLLQSGGYHPTFIHMNRGKPSTVSTILTICLPELKIKENARISNALTFTHSELNNPEGSD